MSRTIMKPGIRSLLAASLLTAVAVSADVEENFEQTYALSADGRIRVENVNGDIKVEAWDRNEVAVRYVKSGGNQEELDRVEVTIDANSDSLSIDTEYKKRKSSWHHGNNGSVDFSLMVPTNARLNNVSSVNGSLDIRGVAGGIESSTVNGRIEVRDVSADLDLETVNGTIEAWFKNLAGDQRVSLETVNGRIIVWLPENADVAIDAETVHGGISNDFGLKVDKGFVGRDLNGKLGSGNARLDLETVNGSIKIKKN